MECARGLCCALRFGPLRRVRPLAPGKFRKKRGSAKCGRPLLLDMTIARRRQGFGFANGVGRLLSVVHVATSCVINVSPAEFWPARSRVSDWRVTRQGDVAGDFAEVMSQIAVSEDCESVSPYYCLRSYGTYTGSQTFARISRSRASSSGTCACPS